LSILLNRLEFEKLSINELAFVWTSCIFSSGSIDLPDIFEEINLSFESLFERLSQNQNCDNVLTNEEIDSVLSYGFGSVEENAVYNKMFKSLLTVNFAGRITDAYYSIIYNEENEGIEIILLRNEKTSVKVKHLKDSARDRINEVSSFLASMISST
jgi:hypothetical protein